MLSILCHFLSLLFAGDMRDKPICTEPLAWQVYSGLENTLVCALGVERSVHSDELNKTVPLNTLVQRNWLPVIRAAIALQRKDPNRAIDLLQTSSEIELGENRLLPAYLRGEAYLMLHDGKHAATEFQKYIDHRALIRNAPEVRSPTSAWPAPMPCRETPPKPALHIRIS